MNNLYNFREMITILKFKKLSQNAITRYEGLHAQCDWISLTPNPK